MNVSLQNKKMDSKELRLNILDMAKAGNAVHIGCSFSLVEILAVLYEKFVHLDANDLTNPDRDLVALSKGHGVMAVYACLYQLGILTKEEVDKYFSTTNQLKGLSSVHVRGVEVSGGSLGHGLTVAVGMALGLKKLKKTNKVFCIVGDGEMNEGSIWESLLFAAQHKLDNLVLIVDQNDFQAMGKTSEVVSLGNLAQKLTAFDFDTIEVDGHDRSLLEKTFDRLVNSSNTKPKALIAKTIKGKGVTFMENNNIWHYARLNDDNYAAAVRELKNAN